MNRAQRKRQAKEGRQDLRRLERRLNAEGAGRLIAGRCAGCDRKIAATRLLISHRVFRGPVPLTVQGRGGPAIFPRFFQQFGALI